MTWGLDAPVVRVSLLTVLEFRLINMGGKLFALGDSLQFGSLGEWGELVFFKGGSCLDPA